jgi:isopentenyl-diphosphate delta-isomerase type 1
MAATEQVILVDKNDNAIGVAEKLEAHRKALCHRAFSVFVVRFASEWEVLLQQRAKEKYHSPSLWTNTCCSHPRPGEEVIEAAERRLEEEMGLILPLQQVGQFHYIAHFDNGLTENEVDHVLVGKLTDEKIFPNPDEVQAYRWVTVTQLKMEIEANPEKFTPWLLEALEVIRFLF